MASLHEMYLRGRAALPSVSVPEEAFAAHVRSVANDRDLDTLCAEDLYLACGCARGDPASLAAFDASYAEHISAVLARVDAPEALREEAKQLMRKHLFVAEGSAPPRIASYAGRGELLAFVRVVATRTLLGLLRKERARPGGDDDDLWRIPDEAEDPELVYLRELYGGEFKRAFEEALDTLPARDKTVLRYHLVDRLSIDRIAAILGVHRATAARRLEKIRQALVSGTRRALMRRLHVSLDELDSIMRLIESNVDLSASRLLRSD